MRELTTRPCRSVPFRCYNEKYFFRFFATQGEVAGLTRMFFLTMNANLAKTYNMFMLVDLFHLQNACVHCFI